MKNQTIDIRNFAKNLKWLDRSESELYDPVFFKEPELHFWKASERFQKQLAAIIQSLNKVDLPSFQDELMHEHVFRLSQLEWDQHNVYDVNSELYRRRFLTLLFTVIGENFSRICEREYMYHTPGEGIYEHQYFYLLDMMKKIKKLHSKFLDSNDWRDLILQFLEYTYFITVKKKKKAEKMIDGTNRYVMELRDGCQHGFFTKPLLDPNIAVDDILKLSVLLTTGTPFVNATPAFELFKKKIPGNDTYRYEIGYIGKTAMCMNKDPDRNGVLYRIFKDASPQIEYSISGVAENPYLREGITALEFVRFIVNDKYVSELIDKLLEKKTGWR